MKKRILSIVFAALLVMSAGAQTDSPAVKQKINKKNLVIKEWITKPGVNKPVLDHTTTYSPEGKKIDEIEYGENRQKWRKRYEYNASGKVNRELLYDEHNRLVNYKKFEYNEFGRKKTQYTYDPKGRLVSTKSFEYLAEDA